jgi:lipopolysaccharide/colanic/teichoic acid biosynthesis glycosyltransferase
LGRTGLTGLWFTEGLNENDKEELEKLDIFYAKNQSIWLDLDILGKTFSKMLLSRS